MKIWSNFGVFKISPLRSEGWGNSPPLEVQQLDIYAVDLLKGIYSKTGIQFWWGRGVGNETSDGVATKSEWLLRQVWPYVFVYDNLLTWSCAGGPGQQNHGGHGPCCRPSGMSGHWQVRPRHRLPDCHGHQTIHRLQWGGYREKGRIDDTMYSNEFVSIQFTEFNLSKTCKNGYKLFILFTY